MKTWTLQGTYSSKQCDSKMDIDGAGVRDWCTAYACRCTAENCRARVQDELITAEWLESLGYKKEKKYSWAEYRLPMQDGFFELVASFFVGSQNVKLMHYERGNILPRIKNRHQFSKLYRLLADRELGDG